MSLINLGKLTKCVMSCEFDKEFIVLTSKLSASDRTILT